MEKSKLIGHGRTAEIYSWGDGYILKLYQAWMPPRFVQDEFTVTRAAKTAGLPVPETNSLVEIDGRCGIVFERLEGLSMLKVLSQKPWFLPEMARRLGELHAHIHASQASAGLPQQKQQILNGIEARCQPVGFRSHLKG